MHNKSCTIYYGIGATLFLATLEYHQIQIYFIFYRYILLSHESVLCVCGSIKLLVNRHIGKANGTATELHGMQTMYSLQPPKKVENGGRMWKQIRHYFI